MILLPLPSFLHLISTGSSWNATLFEAKCGGGQVLRGGSDVLVYAAGLVGVYHARLSRSLLLLSSSKRRNPMTSSTLLLP